MDPLQKNPASVIARKKNLAMVLFKNIKDPL